jgi:hypothetical protein
MAKIAGRVHRHSALPITNRTIAIVHALRNFLLKRVFSNFVFINLYPQSRLVGYDLDEHSIAHPGIANQRLDGGDFHIVATTNNGCRVISPLGLRGQNWSSAALARPGHTATLKRFCQADRAWGSLER